MYASATSRRLLVRVFCLAALSAAVPTSSAQATRRGRAPSFAGIESATTCIPGPTRDGQTSSFHLTWEPVKRRGAASRTVVYEVYDATSSGGENYATPAYTTPPGVASFDTPPLSGDFTYYFIVRARTRSGAEDTNTVEREGQNLCV
jgi:hypothetical protein